MKTLRVAIVGCGTFGARHAEGYSALGDGIEIVAVCDVAADRAADFATRCAVKSHYSDYTAMLDAEAPDLVSICTMPDTHFAVGKAALTRGAHVLCEKPPGLNADEVEALISLANSKDRILTFGFNMRFRRYAAELKSFIESGGIGRHVATRAWAFHSYVPWSGRHQIKALSGGGALASSAVHVIDFVMWLAGNPAPATATASMATIFPKKRASNAPAGAPIADFDVEDTLGGHVRFADGSWMTLDCAWGQDGDQENAYGFEMIGDKGTVWFDPVKIMVERDGKPVDIGPEVLGDIDHEDDMRYGEKVVAALHAEIADVVGAIRGGGTPRVQAKEALDVQRVMDALYNSAEHGREVVLGE